MVNLLKLQVYNKLFILAIFELIIECMFFVHKNKLRIKKYSVLALVIKIKTL